MILMRLKRPKKNRKFSLRVRAQDRNMRTFPEGKISVYLKLKNYLTERRETKHWPNISIIKGTSFQRTMAHSESGRVNESPYPYIHLNILVKLQNTRSKKEVLVASGKEENASEITKTK